MLHWFLKIKTEYATSLKEWKGEVDAKRKIKPKGDKRFLKQGLTIIFYTIRCLWVWHGYNSQWY